MLRASSCPSPGAYKLRQPPLFYRWNVVLAVLLVVVGPDRPRPMTLLPPRSNDKPEAATAVYKLLMMGMRMPETCWAVFKQWAINLRDWCIWLVWFIWVPWSVSYFWIKINILKKFNTVNAELNPICHLLALLGVHHFLHINRIRVNLLKPGCFFT